jgi:cytochrome c oxidase assembly factor CtaG
MMIFSEHPIFAIYELAPPPGGDALDDQQLAGALMEIGLAWTMFVAVIVIFKAWMRRDPAGGAEPVAPHLSPPPSRL